MKLRSNAKKLRKRFIAVAAALAIAVGGIGIGSLPIREVQAEESTDKTDGDWRYTVLWDGTAEITWYDGEETELEIPESVGGIKVTSIGSYAFASCDGLISVTIPEGVTSIGIEAFSGCSSLASVSVPSSVISIGKSAFSDTKWFENKLEENPLVIVNDILIYGGEVKGDVIIPEGVKSIGDYAFAFCGGLTSVTIPGSVTSIGRNAFNNCYSLTSVTMLEGVASIGHDAFSCCTLLTSVTIPGSVVSIGDGAFSVTKWLEDKQKESPFVIVNGILIDGSTAEGDVAIPEEVTSIGNYAFKFCSALTSVSIPEGVTSIGDYAFAGCSGLTSVSIPEGVTSIGNSAFEFCSALTSVSIPEGVTSIGMFAFSDCSGLTNVSIPQSVASIGDRAFGNCPNLTIYCYANSEAEFHAQILDISYWSYAVLEDGTAEIEGYDGDSTALNIPADIRGVPVTSIGKNAFENCSFLTVTIPEGVTSIEYGAFSNCRSLTSVNIPEGVTSIGEYTFAFCDSLTSLSIPEGVTSIGHGAFYSCEALASVNIPEGVTSIGLYAFDNTAWIEARYEENVVVVVNDMIIGVDRKASEAAIPEGVTGIERLVFWNCDSLTKVTIPKSVTNIEENALGYAYDSDWNLIKVPGFTIYGYAGSFAETYANENGFTFIEIKEEPVEEPTEAPTENTTEESTEVSTEEPTEAPTEEPTEVSTEEPTEVSTEEPIETPTENPTEAPAENPDETSSDAAITVDATGEFAPKLEMTKNEILSALSKLFTEEQLEAIKTGAMSLDITLDVTNIDGSVSDEDKELIAKAITDITDNNKFNFKVMNYLDIKLGALIDGKSVTVSETDGMITVSVELEKPANGTYKVIRIHDGKTDIIDSKLSKDGKRLTFRTDKFSTYAIVYSDVASGDGTSAALIVVLGMLAVGSVILVNGYRSVKEM